GSRSPGESRGPFSRIWGGVGVLSRFRAQGGGGGATPGGGGAGGAGRGGPLPPLIRGRGPARGPPVTLGGAAGWGAGAWGHGGGATSRGEQAEASGVRDQRPRGGVSGGWPPGRGVPARGAGPRPCPPVSATRQPGLGPVAHG